MLDIKCNVNFDVKKVSSPIYFDGKNICTHCGASNSLEFIDKWGKVNREEIKAFDHIRCANCGKIYSILWKKRPNSSKMYPSAIDTNIFKDFMNIINSDIKNNGEKRF